MGDPTWVHARVNSFAGTNSGQMYQINHTVGEKSYLNKIGIPTLGSKLDNPMRIIVGQYHIKLGCVKILNYRMGYITYTYNTYQIYIWIFYVMAHN